MYAGQNSQSKKVEPEHEHLANRLPLPAIPSPGSSITSPSSQISTAAHVPSTTPDMDDSKDGYRRRKAVSNIDQDGRTRSKPGSHTKAHRNRGKDLDDDARSKRIPHSLEDEHNSDRSSLPTSEDVELEEYTSEGSVSDEETGLATKDKQRRQRRRPRASTLADRPDGSSKTAKQEQKLADKNVMQAMIVNALLIASWYLFSVSISVVGHKELLLLAHNAANKISSIIDGCFRRAISTSTFPSLQRACTWSSNFS